MTQRLPSLRAVVIFVAAGRTLSFTAAAKAVNLTPSAVSRRIRDLERELGTALFRRFSRRLELTAAGARYLQGVSPAIDPYRARAIQPRRRGTTPWLGTAILRQSVALPRLAHSRPGRTSTCRSRPERADRPDRRALRCRHPLRQRTLAWPCGRTPVQGAVFPVAAPGPLPRGSPPRPPPSTRTTCSTSRRRPPVAE